MADISFQIEADRFDTLAVDDMGEGCLVLSQRSELGKVERVSVSRDQLLKVLEATAERYGSAKNTDRGAALTVAA